MEEKEEKNATEIDREKLIQILTDELPSLRAKIGVSQDELSNLIGISRQTYSAIETRKRSMSWKIFLSLLFVFDQNEKTSKVLRSTGAFPEALSHTININRRPNNGTSSN